MIVVRMATPRAVLSDEGGAGVTEVVLGEVAVIGTPQGCTGTRAEGVLVSTVHWEDPGVTLGLISLRQLGLER